MRSLQKRLAEMRKAATTDSRAAGQAHLDLEEIVAVGKADAARCLLVFEQLSHPAVELGLMRVHYVRVVARGLVEGSQLAPSDGVERNRRCDDLHTPQHTVTTRRTSSTACYKCTTCQPLLLTATPL